ncbi:MAG TPA: site-specific integrase [Candidatus Flavonifractor intestinipullorum]|uniref:Site-specific integrase n=1 Tax=Candidatus Flavonifractor intestinipullorum TaxID=2838587 RepID=A0A9D2MBC8_9FIRM|nr:site-specific integrase [Candidatus Flavonifractor intestinipullorum]
MANITPRKNKAGEVISYQIRVFRGRNADGTRLKDYMMTWKPSPGMTKRQIAKELERQATLFEEACRRGQVSIEKPTFEKYAAYVVDLKERNGLKVKTAVRYRDMLRRINAEIGPVKLQDLRPDHLNRFYAKLAEPGQNQRTGGGLSPKTILEHHRVISTILAQAVKEQLILFNTAERATPPKMPKHEMDAFEVEEVRAILEALETEPLKWQVCVQLLIATGARRGEVMGLRWEHVDWVENKLYLCENRVYTPQSGVISTTLKTGENRYVSVSPSVMALLKRWRAEQAAGFMKLGITPSGYVLTAENGGPMHPDSPTDWLSKFSKRHGLPPIHPHKFRHTQASLLIAQGVDILTVSKRLGHAKVSTTLDIYSHVLAKSDEKASDTLDRLFYQKKAQSR